MLSISWLTSALPVAVLGVLVLASISPSPTSASRVLQDQHDGLPSSHDAQVQHIISQVLELAPNLQPEEVDRLYNQVSEKLAERMTELGLPIHLPAVPADLVVQPPVVVPPIGDQLDPILQNVKARGEDLFDKISDVVPAAPREDIADIGESVNARAGLDAETARQEIEERVQEHLEGAEATVGETLTEVDVAVDEGHSKLEAILGGAEDRLDHVRGTAGALDVETPDTREFDSVDLPAVSGLVDTQVKGVEEVKDTLEETLSRLDDVRPAVDASHDSWMGRVDEIQADEVDDRLQEVQEDIGDKHDHLMDEVKGILDDVDNRVRDATDDVDDKVQDAMDDVDDILDDVDDRLSDVMDDVDDKVSDAMDDVDDILDDVDDRLSDVMDDVDDKVSDAMDDVDDILDDVDDRLSDVADDIDDAHSNALDHVDSELDDAADLISDRQDDIDDAHSAALDHVERELDDAADLISERRDDIDDANSAALDHVEEELDEAEQLIDRKEDETARRVDEKLSIVDARLAEMEERILAFREQFSGGVQSLEESMAQAEDRLVAAEADYGGSPTLLAATERLSRLAKMEDMLSQRFAKVQRRRTQQRLMDTIFQA